MDQGVEVVQRERKMIGHQIETVCESANVHWIVVVRVQILHHRLRFQQSSVVDCGNDHLPIYVVHS